MNQLAEAKRTQLLEEGLAIIYRSQVTPGHAQVALDLKPSLCLGVVEVVGGWATVPGVPPGGKSHLLDFRSLHHAPRLPLDAKLCKPLHLACSSSKSSRARAATPVRSETGKEVQNPPATTCPGEAPSEGGCQSGGTGRPGLACKVCGPGSQLHRLRLLCAHARSGPPVRAAAQGATTSSSGAVWAKCEGLRVTMRLAPLRRAKVAWSES